MRTTEENFALHKELWTWVADNQHMLATKWDWPYWCGVSPAPLSNCFLCDVYYPECNNCPLGNPIESCLLYEDFSRSNCAEERTAIALKIANERPKKVKA